MMMRISRFSTVDFPPALMPREFTRRRGMNCQQMRKVARGKTCSSANRCPLPPQSGRRQEKVDMGAHGDADHGCDPSALAAKLRGLTARSERCHQMGEIAVR